LRDSVKLGFTDSHIALGYLGGFVARASTVAISLFIPLFINTFFISKGFCQGQPNDPSPELKKECRQAYILASILTGVAQLMGLICAPVFGYLSGRSGRINIPIMVATVFGIVGYIIFPSLPSPEPRDVDGRGGSPVIFLVVSLIGISQIGAIVCSLGSLGQGVLTADMPPPLSVSEEVGLLPAEEDDQTGEAAPLLENGTYTDAPIGPAAPVLVSRVRLKGSIAGMYSWCGGAAILLLTKLGGYLFDKVSNGAPFYMMASFNAILLVTSLGIDIGRILRKKAV
jgi:MFS family permease